MAETKKNIYQKLQAIQTELKAPKDLYNSFGNYHYRNAESICEALKPLEEKYSVATIISDSIQLVGERFYVTSTVTLYDADSGETLSVSASARESITKKGMDDAQITGATSSYARKYALNGMFLLDDTKDVDSEEYQAQEKGVKTAPKKTAPAKKTEQKPTPAPAPAPAPKTEQFPNRNKFLKICQKNGFDVKAICDEYGLTRNSKDEEFEAAVGYVQMMEGQLAVQQVDELAEIYEV